MFLQQVVYFEVPQPNTYSAGQNLTSVKYFLGKLSEACGDKEVARDLENDEHVSLEANVSPFPFTLYSLQSFWVYY